MTSKQQIRLVSMLALLWWAGLLALPITERTFLGAKTHYCLFVGLGLVFVTVEGKILAMCTALLGATHGVTFVAIILQALSRPSSGSDHR